AYLLVSTEPWAWSTARGTKFSLAIISMVRCWRASSLSRTWAMSGSRSAMDWSSTFTRPPAGSRRDVGGSRPAILGRTALPPLAGAEIDAEAQRLRLETDPVPVRAAGLHVAGERHQVVAGGCAAVGQAQRVLRGDPGPFPHRLPALDAPVADQP